MLTFRKGTGGALHAARAMADYLADQALPAEMAGLADYYSRGTLRSGTAGVIREDVSAAYANALGLDPSRPADAAEVANLLQGLRADGQPIAGKQQQAAAPGRDRVTYLDLTFSASKSVSVAMALAPTDDERQVIVGAHRDAWNAAMGQVEAIVGHARKGHAGSKGAVAGRIGWLSFDHFTSRPTVDLAHTEADGTASTIRQSVPIAGDPQLHSHIIIQNVVVCPDGSVGGLDTVALHDRVHEVGALYQAHLATNLRAAGIAVELDQKTGSARLPAVPQAVADLFSKRHQQGEAAARHYVEGTGQDWDALNPAARTELLRHGNSVTRQSKGSGAEADVDTWRAQAKAAGYRHRSVVGTAPDRPAMPEAERIRTAYEAALPGLEHELEHRAVLSGGTLRTAAARGLIASGIKDASDIDRVTAAMREHGVRHDGQMAGLVWATEPAEPPIGGREPRVKVTTTVHVAQERVAMTLASRAAADRTGALSPDQISTAVARVEARDGLDFSGEHGGEQRRVMDALGTGGRLAVATGVAGSGKTALLRPLIDAWAEDGRTVYGTALAWRQAGDLAGAGIEKDRTMAVARLLKGARDGKVTLDRRSVVVVDELSQIGTRQALELLQLRERHGFTMVAIGDDRQGQSIEAGSTIELLRRAMPQGAVPELGNTVRQATKRDRETATMFRDGRAEEAIGRLREDGRARLVPGGRREAVEAVADLWAERQAANAGRDGYTLTVSAPTNADAREISGAIRERKRGAGDLGPDVRTVRATDQSGATYDLPLATGDRVRLFSRTYADIGKRGAVIGDNGSVVQVERIADRGLHVRNAKGTRGLVKWDALRDQQTGRVKLTYGDALTIDAAQGATSTEHINALPGGSSAVHGFKAYVAQSRAREATWLVTSDGAERAGVAAKRALGSTAPVGEPDVWRHVSENLSRQPERLLASDVVLSANRKTTQADRDAARSRMLGRSASAAQEASRRAQEAAAGRDRAATL